MDRKSFIRNTGFISGGIILGGSSSITAITQQTTPMQPGEAMRWAQLAFVEMIPAITILISGLLILSAYMHRVCC